MIESNIFCKQNFREALYDWFLKISRYEYRKSEQKADGTTFIKMSIFKDLGNNVTTTPFRSDNLSGMSPYADKFNIINYLQYNSKFIAANTEGQISKGNMEVGLMLCLRGNDYTNVFRSEFQKLESIKMHIDFYYRPRINVNGTMGAPSLKCVELVGSAVISKISDLSGVTDGNQSPICIDIEFYKHKINLFRYNEYGEFIGQGGAFNIDYYTGQFMG